MIRATAFFLGLAIIGLVSVHLAAAEGEEEILALTKSKCVLCHSMRLTCRKLGTKDVDGWQMTVEAMVEHGMTLKEGQSEAMARFLATISKNDERLCP